VTIRQADSQTACKERRVSTRRLHAGIALAGLLSVTLATAFLAHLILEIAQSTGLLSGDYGHHGHGSVFPVGLGAAAIALCGIFLYAMHLADVTGSSLPSLAHDLRKRIGWQAIACGALGACLVLVAMESTEQWASGSFDGVASAFGGVPLVGLGLILFICSLCNALAWVVCNWLVNAHARLVSVIALLLRLRSFGAPLTGHLSKRTALTAFDYTSDASQAHGKRAPPRLAS
jgi:hypothetical protein